MFKSDFKIVADYFVQVRTNKKYKPSPQKIKHVHEVLQLMAIFTNDKRFEEFQNFYVKGEEMTMCDVLDEAEARGVFFLFGETPKLFFKRILLKL